MSKKKHKKSFEDKLIEFGDWSCTCESTTFDLIIWAVVAFVFVVPISIFGG